MKHYLSMILAGAALALGFAAAPAEAAPIIRLQNSCPVHKHYVPECGKCQRNNRSCPVHQYYVPECGKCQRNNRSCPVHQYYVPECGKCQRNAAARGYRIEEPRHHGRPVPPPHRRPVPPPHRRPVPPPHRH